MQDAAEVADFVLSLAKQRGARLIVKSKSMTTEEIDLNERLEHHQLESVETDLGEYILQLAHERPVPHRRAGAAHDALRCGAIFSRERLGVEREVVIENQTRIARRVLREKFLAADIGITGANFLVADSGAVVVVENEGNARLSSSAPRDSHRDRRHREGDPARPGSGGLSETAGTQRHRPAAHGLHVVSLGTAPAERDRRPRRVSRGSARQRPHKAAGGRRRSASRCSASVAARA